MALQIRNDMLPPTLQSPASVLAVGADGSEQAAEYPVVQEHPLDILVNEQPFARLVCTPIALVELVLGRLYSEGLVRSTEEIASLHICRQGSRARVFLHAAPALQQAVEQEPSCCTDNRTLLRDPAATPLLPLEPAEFRPEWIFSLTRRLQQDTTLHRLTQGTHSCYLSAAGKILFAAEDIGRHNAMDKCIGHMLLHGIPPERCILFTTGRIPTDMARKVIRARIPIVVSKAVPTDAAIAMAQRYHLTLLGRAWPDSYMVFHLGTNARLETPLDKNLD